MPAYTLGAAPALTSQLVDVEGRAVHEPSPGLRLSGGLTALLDDSADFRWTVVGAGDLTVIVCVVGDYPPLLRVCSVPAAAAFRIHLGRRGKAREVGEPADLSAHPRELVEITARVAAAETLE